MSDQETGGSGPQQAELEHLYLVLGGHIFFQTMSAAVQLGLFDTLSADGPQSRSELAERLRVEEKPLRIVLSGCAALRLVRKEADRYVNAELTERFLTRSAPQSLVPIVLWQHHINYKPMWHFHEAIHADDNVGLRLFDGDESTLYGRLTHHPDLEQIFQDAMESISVQANAMLARDLDLSMVRHLVDVGGGNGANIIQLARKYPDLRASVFDSPSVCEIAGKHIGEAGLSDRLDARPGDAFEDPFPEDADALLFAHFLTIWSEDRNQALLKKAHDALPSGGRAIVFNMMQRNEEDGPLSTAIGSPYFLTLATGEGMLYTWREYEEWMRAAGFVRVETKALERDHGVVIGIKS